MGSAEPGATLWGRPLWHYYVAGGIGDVCATCVSHPLDVVKVRQQLTGELAKTSESKGLVQTARDVRAAEGLFTGLYRGITASIARQASFSTLRHGGYATVCHLLVSAPPKGSYDNKTHPATLATMSQKLVAGVLAGAVSATVSNPTDVVLIRMQADGHWPPQQRRQYRHVFHGLHHVIKTEGLSRLWRGCFPTVLRATLVTTSQLLTYFRAKDFFLRHDSWGVFSAGSADARLHLCSSVCSAAAASLATAPVDVIKTRIMNMQAGPRHYSGTLDCVTRTIKAEGISGLYKGLLPTFARLAPHTVVLWLVQEAILGHLAST